jgi:hypothetical protein
MKFWIKRAGNEEWVPISAEDGLLFTDTYTIIAHSPQPHFTITVDVHQYRLVQSDGSEAEVAPPAADLSQGHKLQQGEQLQHLQRSIRTNDEGIGVILPATALTPGLWELHCHDADLIAELFGEGQSNTLRFQVVAPVTSQALGDPLSVNPSDPAFSHLQIPTPVPAATPATEPLPLPVPPPIPLASAPQSYPLEATLAPIEPPNFSLVHTELEGSPGEFLVLTGRIGSSGDLAVEVFAQDQPIFQSQRSIQFPADAKSAAFSIPIPLPATPWQGDLVGNLTLKGSTGQPSPSIQFTVSCLEPMPSDPSATLESRVSSAPLDHDPSSVGLAPQSHSFQPSVEIPLPSSTPSAAPSPTAETLLVGRTWQKLLSISQVKPAAGGSAPEPILEHTLPPATGVESLPTQISHLAEPAVAEDSLLTAEPQWFPHLLHPDPLLDQPLQQEPILPQPPPPDPVVWPESSAFPTGSNPADLPVPQVAVPDQVRAGETIDIILTLNPLSPQGSGNQDHPLWIKFWVKHGQTRSLVDGPRWLLDFTRTDQGQWQAITRMTVPLGIPTLIFEAWSVSPDLKQQSSRTTLKRSIRS